MQEALVQAGLQSVKSACDCSDRLFDQLYAVQTAIRLSSGEMAFLMRSELLERNEVDQCLEESNSMVPVERCKDAIEFRLNLENFTTDWFELLHSISDVPDIKYSFQMFFCTG